MFTRENAEECRILMLPILLFDVAERYVTALRAWGEQSEVAVVIGSLDAAALPRNESVSMCVVGCSGREDSLPSLLRSLRKQHRGCPIVVVARTLSVDGIVRALRAGATDVIELPPSVDDLVARLAAIHAQSIDVDDPDGLAGRSACMQELRRQIRQAARTQSTVLVTGETGVGKGLVARRLHALSSRSHAPFVHVDCSSFAPTVVESELFGHERGAFTGATSQRIGRFEQANGGVLFLDEIGDLDVPLQRKLLRALQDRQFERVGGTRPLPFTARVIAATHRDLHAGVSRGEFRADLLFRLNVIHLEVPPLRERLEDIPVLVRTCIDQLSERLQIDPPHAQAAFLEQLASYWWPGNVRELMNVLERVLVRDRGGALDEESVEEILATARRHAAVMLGSPASAVRRAQAIPYPEVPSPGLAADVPSAQRASIPVERPENLDNDEVEQMRRVLLETGGNLSRAARRLGVARSTLRYRVMLLGLERLIPKD